MNKHHMTYDPLPKACVYRDSDGNTYKVLAGIGGGVFKARKNKPGSSSWKGMRQLEWRESFVDAQADLDEHAKSEGWYPMGSQEDSPC